MLLRLGCPPPPKKTGVCCSLIGVLQLVGFVLFVLFWPAVLDYTVFLFDCEWTQLSSGGLANHVFFKEQSKSN